MHHQLMHKVTLQETNQFITISDNPKGESKLKIRDVELQD